eukprot:COSAG04_NODE_519_length_13169_cov_10.968248_13_plen_289_part_00
MLVQVELVLIREAQAAQRQATACRVQLSERQEQLHAIAQEWKGAKALLEQREALIAQLEAHLDTQLAAAQPVADGTPADAARNGGSAAEILHGAIGAETAAAAPAAAADAAASGAEPAARAATAGGGGSVLEVVSAQRDRLRGRVQGLEEDVARLETEAKDAKAKAAKALKEQEALRQRLRFVQSAGGAAAGGGRGGSVASLAAQEDDRYVPTVPTVDPFREFEAKQSRQAEARLGAVERLALDFSRGFLGNRLGRRFLFVYILLLHVITYTSILSHADHHLRRLAPL